MLPMVGLMIVTMVQPTPAAAQQESSAVEEVKETTSAASEKTGESEETTEATSGTIEAPETEIRGWATIKGVGTVYITDEGLLTGVQAIDEKLYLFDDNGALRKDNAWVIYKDNRYFPNANGELYHDQLITFGPKTAYWMGSDGTPTGGFREVGKALYYFDPETGLRRADNEWIETERGWVFPNAKGEVYHDQLITFGPKVAYYLDHDGSIATGFRQVGKNLMYFNEDGRRNQSNKWIETERGRVFPNANGVVYTNQFLTFGPNVAYYVGEDGTPVSGMVEANGTVYRMTGKDGQRLVESSAYEYEGNEYFADAMGHPFRDCVVKVGGKQYYYGEDGAKVYDDFSTDDYEYCIDSETGEILSCEEIPQEPEAPYIYDLGDLRFQGVIYWSGYKFTYYSQSVLPGGGLNIPGRHVNEAGFVADGDGYIVLANSAPKGTIIPTPFGYYGKVYDRGTYGNHFDVYTK
ncbi:MAG: hypothetical protein SPI19_04925 [Peptoniphilaceae bacterium]|nr:hypothetical protein [Peptoniphilaceae bacterium]